MRFLSYLFFALIIFALAAFAAANWVMVTVKLLPSWELVIRLPVLMFAMLMIGALPATLLHSVSKWSWRRKLTRTERELENSRVVGTEPTVSSPANANTMPPQAQPLIVPPAGA